MVDLRISKNLYINFSELVFIFIFRGFDCGFERGLYMKS